MTQLTNIRGVVHGRTIELDRLIAAIAIVHDLILVTHNLKDFEHIPGLSVIDWITE